MKTGLLASGVGVSIRMGSKGTRYDFKIDDVHFSKEVFDYIKDNNEGETKEKKLDLSRNYFRNRKVEVWIK